jgi:hypothetical protein
MAAEVKTVQTSRSTVRVEVFIGFGGMGKERVIRV